MLFEAFKRNREERPNDAAFLIAAGDRYLPVSWKQFTDDISVVSWIIERHASNGKIAILGENSYEWMVLHTACLFSSAIAVSVEPGLSADDIASRLKYAGVGVLMHSALYSEKAHEIAVRIPGLSTGSFGSRKTDAFIYAALKALRLLPHKDVWERESVDIARTSMMVFTSGTTSEPRAVELTITSIETFAQSVHAALKFNRGDTSLMLLPLHHIYGIATTYAMLMNCVALGVCPDFRRIFAAFVRFKANYAFLVPALADILAAKIAQVANNAEEALGTPIDWIVTGGAPISRRTYERLTSLGVKMLAAYGLTETAACYSISSLDDEPRPCSAGKVSQAPGVETRVSEDGELLIRGPNVMKGYYAMPERTLEVIDGDGWFHTGDAGTIDQDGYVWVTGRISRTIVLSSGKKVAPEEIESKVLALPGILEVMVTGEGESRQIMAEIYATVSEDSVNRSVASLNACLPVYQRINKVVLRNSPFPRTASGKIKLR